MFLVPSCRLPSRNEQQAKSCRWHLYIEQRSATRVLWDVLEKGTAKVSFHDLGPSKIELAWTHAVTYQSVQRLIHLAKVKNESFRTMGVPAAIFDDEAEPAEPPDEVEEETQKKRLRLLCKTPQPPAAAPQTPALATRKTPRTPALQAATSAPPEPLACGFAVFKHGKYHCRSERTPLRRQAAQIPN